MAYASQVGRARTSSVSPQAHAICDRCGFRYNFVDLHRQYEWLGATLQPIGNLLVCERCLDIPQEQLRAITLPADPVPIIQARPELYAQDSLDYIGTGQPTIDPVTGIPVPSREVLGGATTSDVIIPQPTGPNGSVGPSGVLNPGIGADPRAQAPLVKATVWATPIPITSIVANGTPVLTVNCSAPHNLASGNQVAMWGVSNPLGYGFFNVTVTTATVFTVQANANIPSGTINTSSTKVITTNLGVPWQVTQVPQTGV